MATNKKTTSTNKKPVKQKVKRVAKKPTKSNTIKKRAMIEALIASL